MTKKDREIISDFVFKIERMIHVSKLINFCQLSGSSSLYSAGYIAIGDFEKFYEKFKKDVGLSKFDFYSEYAKRMKVKKHI